MYFKMETPAEKRLLTAVPVRIKILILFLHIFATRQTAPSEIQPKANALTAIREYPENMALFFSRVVPVTMASAAPKDAPLETPSVNGEASGLRRIFCITHPESPSAAPVSEQRITLGSRT